MYQFNRPAPQPPIEEPVTTPINVTLGIVTYNPVVDRHFGYIANVTLTDVNDYAASNGYRYRFSYMQRNTAGVTEGLEKGVIVMNEEEGVNMFLGFDSTEYMCASLNYAMHHHVILMGSPLIHHDSSALPDDEMFRVGPDLRQIHKVVKYLPEALGVESAVMIYRGKSWGDGVNNALSETLGEDRIQTIRYDAQTTDFEATLDLASEKYAELVAKYGAEHTAIIIEGTTEIADVVNEALTRGELLSSRWIVLEESNDPYSIEAWLPSLTLGTTNVSLYSLQMESLLDNAAFTDLQAGYAATNPPDGDTLGLIDASFRDSIWIMCLSVMEANSTDAEVLKGVIPGVAYNYTGASGGVFLDVNGDRVVDYGVYKLENGVWVKVGEYTATKGKITLD